MGCDNRALSFVLSAACVREGIRKIEFEHARVTVCA